MTWNEKDEAARRAWIEAWLRDHPQPSWMIKPQRWRTAHAAWLEMRRQTKAAERAARKLERQVSRIDAR